MMTTWRRLLPCGLTSLLLLLPGLTSSASAQGVCDSSFTLRATACPGGGETCSNKGSSLTHAELDANFLNLVDLCNTNTEGELETHLGSIDLLVSTELDTEAELEALVASLNFIISTEIDTSSELAAILGDESGSGSLLFGTSPTIATPVLTLVNSAAPTPTAEAVIEWESDDDHLIVGDGVDQVEFVPTEDVSGDATMTTAGVVTVADNSHSHTESNISDLDHLTEAEARTGLIENGSAEMTGETLGTACAENEILKANATGGLDCAADATSGSPTFDQIGAGTNTSAAMVVGTGASLAASGSGTIAATTAAALAANGANCSVGNYARGVSAAGVSEGCTADVTLSQEEVEDFAGGMDDGTNTRLTFTYNDASGNFDIVVDDMNDDVPEAGDFSNLTGGTAITNSPTGTINLDLTASPAITGEWNFGGGGLEIENNTVVPGSCTVGQVFLDTDATSGQQLYACEGGAFVLQGDGGGAETNDLESVATSAGDAEVFVGTGVDAGAYITGLAACAADEKIEYVPGAPDTFTCEAIGSLVEADVTDLDHLTEAEARTALIENGSAEMTGETLGTACAENQILKANATGGLDCAADATGGSPTFDQIGGGTNTTAAMVVGTGSSLAATGSGAITATAAPASGISGTDVGTDLTADLEEETHGSEHNEGGTDEVTVEALGTACGDGQAFDANATTGVECVTVAGDVSGSLDALVVADNSHSHTESNISDLSHTATAITDNLIVEADLNEDSGTPTDEDVLTYDSTGANFNWVAQSTLAAGTAAALAANGGNCAAGEIPLGVDASGAVEGCYEPSEADISDLSHVDSTKMPLAGGTFTGEVIFDNLGVDFQDSDTNPTCAAGDYLIYADLSETTLKKCLNGVLTDLDTTGGTPAFSDISGATNTTAAMVVGTGASLSATGSGTITATAVPASGVSGTDAGTDLTADLEEEAHCSEHDSADVDCSGETIVYAANSVNEDELAPTITMAATDLLDMSGTDSSTATEGLILPQHATACTDYGSVTDGQVCWDADSDALYVGDGLNWIVMNAGELNDLEASSLLIQDGEIFVGTGIDNGEYVGTLTACAADEKIEYTPGTPDTFSCEAIGGLVEADVTDLDHLTEAEARAGLIENGSAEMFGETLGTACAENQILKANATGGLDCAADAGGGGGDIISEGDSNVEVIDAGTGQVDIDLDGVLAFQFNSIASLANGIDFNAAAAGNSPTIAAVGSDASIRLSVQGKGSNGEVAIAPEGTDWFLFNDDCSTVGCLRGASGGSAGLRNATASATVATVVPNYSDSDTGMGWAAADTVSVAAGGIEAARFNTVASGVNYLDVTPAATFGDVIVAAAGTDSNIDLALYGKGTATIRLDSDGDGTAQFIVGGVTTQSDANDDGTVDWVYSSTQFNGNDANGPALRNESASLINPTILPDKLDTDTGMGGDSADTGSLVAGGADALQWTEAGYGTAAGDTVMLVPDLATAPTSNPTGGVLLYSDGDSLWIRDTGGTATDLAASGSGDIQAVGDCTTGSCFTAASPDAALTFDNATSGTVTLQTVAGALGTVTVSLPAETGTVCTTGSVCTGYEPAITADSLDGDDIAASYAGAYLSETAATPDTIGIDTEVVTRVVSFNVENAQTGDSGNFQAKIPVAATLQRVSCSTTANTCTVNIFERAENSPNTGTTGMLTSNLTCNSDTTADASSTFTDSAVAADSVLALGITASTLGSTDICRVFVDYTVDDA